MNSSYQNHLHYKEKTYVYYELEAVARQYNIKIQSLPYTIRILLESLLRKEDGVDVTKHHIKDLLHYQASCPRRSAV